MQKPPKKGTVAWQAWKAEQRLARAHARIAELEAENLRLAGQVTKLALETKEFQDGFLQAITEFDYGKTC